jgi:hypothetical protein
VKANFEYANVSPTATVLVIPTSSVEKSDDSVKSDLLNLQKLKATPDRRARPEVIYQKIEEFRSLFSLLSRFYSEAEMKSAAFDLNWT